MTHAFIYVQYMYCARTFKMILCNCYTSCSALRRVLTYKNHTVLCDIHEFLRDGVHAYGVYFECCLSLLLAGNFRQEKVARKDEALVILCIVLTSS